MTNNELKYLNNLKQKKYREQENKFLIEGNHLIEEILESPRKKNLEKVFIREDYNHNNILTLLRESNIPVEVITEVHFNKVSDTENSQGVIGLVNKSRQVSENKETGSLCVALDNINDPGNLGTILRTCYWFNVDEILISNDSVELYNPKVVRASQGAIFNMDIKEGVNLTEELEKRYENKWKVYLTDLDAKSFLNNTKFKKNSKNIFVFGNEANGIISEILTSKDYHRIKINSFSACESLNIAISAGIILNEFRKQV